MNLCEQAMRSNQRQSTGACVPLSVIDNALHSVFGAPVGSKRRVPVFSMHGSNNGTKKEKTKTSDEMKLRMRSSQLDGKLKQPILGLWDIYWHWHSPHADMRYASCTCGALHGGAGC